MEKNLIETKNEKFKKNEIESERSIVHDGNLSSLDNIKCVGDTDSLTSLLSRKRSLLDVDEGLEDEVEKTHLNLELNINEREYIEGNDHGMMKKRPCDKKKIIETETDIIEGSDVYANDVNTTDDTCNLKAQNSTNNISNSDNDDNNNDNNNGNDNTGNSDKNNDGNKYINNDINDNNNKSKDIDNKSNGDSSNYVSESIEIECICPICNKDIILLSINDRNVHVNNCCTSDETGVKTPVGAKNSKRKPSLHDYFGRRV
jgi:hypothetical protein